MIKVDPNDPLQRLKGMLGGLERSTGPGRPEVRPLPSPAPGRPGGGDALKLSVQAQELQRAREAVELSPESRTELVESLQREIASGRYRIDGTRIADALLAERQGSIDAEG